MAIIQNRLSTEPFVAPYIDPAGRTHTLNEDWEGGPIGEEDTSEGMNYQAWELTFAAGDFLITPETTGSPIIPLTGVDSVQCSFCFDQNARPTIAWVDSSDQGHLYWYNTIAAEYQTFDFANPVWGLALTLDDKRSKQIAANDILLWYTLPAAGPDHYALFHRKQRDRFDDIYPMADPVWPYIHKLGMHDELRVQIDLSTAPPT
jgi:hypothetical protein